MGSRAIFRMDMGLHLENMFWPLLQSLYRIHVLFRLPEKMCVAHMGSCRICIINSTILASRSARLTWTLEKGATTDYRPL